MKDEKWHEYCKQVECNEEDLEKSLLLDTNTNDAEYSSQVLSRSPLTRMIKEGREASSKNPALKQYLRDNSCKDDIGDTCPQCKQDVTSKINGLECNKCNLWYHKSCIRLIKVGADHDVERPLNTPEQWICYKCCVNGECVRNISSTSTPLINVFQENRTAQDRNNTLNTPKSFCSVFKDEVKELDHALPCDRCEYWTHTVCINMSDEDYEDYKTSGDDWYCIRCIMIRRSLNGIKIYSCYPEVKVGPNL